MLPDIESVVPAIMGPVSTAVDDIQKVVDEVKEEVMTGKVLDEDLGFLKKLAGHTETVVGSMDYVDDMMDFTVDAMAEGTEQAFNASKLIGKKLVDEAKGTFIDKKTAAQMQLEAVKSEVMQLYAELTDGALFKKAEAFELTKEALKDKHAKPVYTFEPVTLERDAFTGQTDINAILEKFANSYTFAKTLSLTKDGHHVLPDGYTRSTIDKKVYYDLDGLSNVVRTERDPMPKYDKHHIPHVEVLNVYNNLKKDPLAIYGELYTPGSHKSNYGPHKVVEELKEKTLEKVDAIKEKIEEKKEATKEKIQEKKAAIKEKVDAAHDKIKEKLDAIKDLVKKDHEE